MDGPFPNQLRGADIGVVEVGDYYRWSCMLRYRVQVCQPPSKCLITLQSDDIQHLTFWQVFTYKASGD